LLSLAKDVEWSIRDLIYRNYDVNAIIQGKDIHTLLQKNYQEYSNTSMNILVQMINSILDNLVSKGILTSVGNVTYRIISTFNRYQCLECSQISYIEEKEDRKCFSCESTNLRERNVR